MNDLDWMARASCRGMHDPDNDPFYPERCGPNAPAVVEARKICRHCPVIAECRAYVDSFELNTRAEGVWAAEAPKQRIARRRARGYRRSGPTPNQGCPWPGLVRAIERHQHFGEPLCLACELAVRRNIDREEREHVVEAALRAGRTDRYIATTTGMDHRSVAARREQLKIGEPRLAPAAGPCPHPGNVRGWVRHERRGEQPCAKCAMAKRHVQRGNGVRTAS